MASDAVAEARDSGRQLPLCPRLPREVEEGSNIEHKLTLAKLTPSRFQELLTQLLWRLREGNGRCRYVLGVSDAGEPIGVSAAVMSQSIESLHSLVGSTRASIIQVQYLRGTTSDAHRVAIVDIGDREDLRPGCRLSGGCRVAVLGKEAAGKSTLIGVLVNGELDDGDGSARLLVARHRHEVEMGRTSSVCRHFVTLDSDGAAVYNASVSLSGTDLVSRPQPYGGDSAHKQVTLIDLPARRHRRTMLRGLLGSLVDYVLLVVSAQQACAASGLEEVACSWSLLRQLRIPGRVVITKCDMVSEGQLADAVKNVSVKFGSATSTPLVISSVSGHGIATLQQELFRVEKIALSVRSDGFLFAVQDVFLKSGLFILAGTCFGGQIRLGESATIGSTKDRPETVTVHSIHSCGQQIDEVSMGESVAIGVQVGCNDVRISFLSKAKILCDTTPTFQQIRCKFTTSDEREVRPKSRVSLFFLTFCVEVVVDNTTRASSGLYVIELQSTQAICGRPPGECPAAIVWEDNLVGGFIESAGEPNR